MLCRIVYAYVHEELGSKKVAGEWAMRVFSKQWRPMIEKALDDYLQGNTAGNADQKQLICFETYCGEYIRKLKDESSK